MKIEKVNVTEQVVSYLKEHIQNGDWKVGEKIPSENKLTEELGVSRASVSAAIGQLLGTGVLESVHGKGTFLVDNDLDTIMASENAITAQDCMDVRKVLEFRSILEPETCAMAASNRTPELLRKLEETLSEMKACGPEERERFVAADMRFHELLAGASGNTLLEKSLHKVFEETQKNHQQMNTLFGSESGIYHHGRILESVREGDAEEAGRRMREHLRSAMERL